jgi:hypothetical protein
VRTPTGRRRWYRSARESKATTPPQEVTSVGAAISRATCGECPLTGGTQSGICIEGWQQSSPFTRASWVRIPRRSVSGDWDSD